MINIAFDGFGNDHIIDEFSYLERHKLRQGVYSALEATLKVKDAANFAFDDHHPVIKLWFGNSDHETITGVITGIIDMYDILSDNTKTITFVNAYGKTSRRHYTTYVPAPGIAGRLSHGGEVATYYTNERVQNRDSRVLAYIHGLSSDFRCTSGSLPYLSGSAFKVYIGPAMFKAGDEGIATTILHELTHKALNTIDLNREGLPVYGRGDCQRLASSDPLYAIVNADCWTFFVFDFNVPPESFCTIL
ncbi:MAG: hypothetical protein KAH18_03200 [Psychromonas sp.]|nr:hypothetical protein [Psychromonas sp.]